MLMRLLSLCLFLSTICYAKETCNHLHENFILPIGTHLLIAKDVDGMIIELEDGAQFTISDFDREEVKKWSPNTPVTITANGKWFSGDLSFYITNRFTGVYVSSKYNSPPENKNPYTNKIHYIDPFEGYITLIDNRGNQTFWEIDRQDLDELRSWRKDDLILVGSYDNWYSNIVSGSQYILINHETSPTDVYIRANVIKSL